MSQLPPGFVLDAEPPPRADGPGGLPAGFVLDAPAAPQADPPIPMPPRAELPASLGVEGPGVAQYVADTLVTQPARGARSGIANLLGLPVDAVSWLANQALRGGTAVYDAVRPTTMSETITGPQPTQPPQIRNPIGGSQSIDYLLSGFGLVPEPPAPRGFLQEGARRVGEEVGASAVPILGAAGQLLRRGAQGLGVTAEAVRGTQAAANPVARVGSQLFVEPMAANPGQFIRGQVGTGIAAGAGAAAVNQVTGAAGYDRSTPVGALGDILGSLGGGVAGALGGATLRRTGDAARMVTGGGGAYRDPTTDAAAASMIADMFGRGPEGTAAIVRQIESGPRPGSVVPGFAETLADRTGNPGVASGTYARAAGPRAGEFAARNSANAEAVNEALQAAAPQGSPGAMIDAATAARDARIAAATTESDRLATEADTALQALRPTMTPEARGQAVRGDLQAAEAQARQGVQEAYAAADIGDVPMNPDALRGALDQTTAGLTATEQSLAPRDLFDRVIAAVDAPEVGPPAQRAAEATSLRTELLGRQRAAEATADGANTARVLGRYIAALDGVIESALTPEQLAAAQAARAAATERFEAFTRPGDPVADALATREGGRPRVPDQNIPGLFVDPRATQPMERLFAQADTPQVRAAIRDELLERAGAATNRADAVRDFTEQYGPALERFPGLREELTRAAGAREAAVEGAAARDATVRDLTTPNRSTLAAVSSYSPETAPSAIRNLMASRDPAAAADELMSAIGGNVDAINGARRAFWNVLEETARSRGNTTSTAGGTQPWMPENLRRFLNDPATSAVAERLYRDNPEHLARIREIAEVLGGVNVAARGRAANTSGTAQGVLGGNILTPETAMSRLYAAETGRVSGAFAAVSLVSVAYRRLMRSGRAQAISGVVDEALLNPDFAAQLLKANNPADRMALRRMVSGASLNRMSSFFDALNDSDDDVERGVRQ